MHVHSRCALKVCRSWIFLLHREPQLDSETAVHGNCTEPPSKNFMSKITGSALLELNLGQCVILSNQAVMPLTGPVWVDNIYFRYSLGSTLGETSEATSAQAPLHVHSGTSYISAVTIQGDGVADTAGLWVFPSGNVLMMGKYFCQAALRMHVSRIIGA